MMGLIRMASKRALKPFSPQHKESRVSTADSRVVGLITRGARLSSIRYESILIDNAMEVFAHPTSISSMSTALADAG
tara:strand:- start:288 stop:518 length:231 start_codon:yes stop_codon:yes gene_type:complete